MSIQSFQESACHYLFGKEAGELYGSKFSEPFINQSLETIMRLNVAFLSKKENDGFPFIDPVAFNDQCHLYSLLAGKIKANYKEKSLEERLAKTQDNRFLHLAFILSHTFLNDRNLLCKAIEVAQKKEDILITLEKDSFYEFVKDSQAILTHAARKSLNQVFERSIKEKLAGAQEKSLLHREFYQLSLQDQELQIIPFRSKDALYTIPKLVGVAYLVEEKMSFVIKTKIISSRGTGMLSYQKGSVKEDEPVLVFEAVASDEFSIQEFRKIAERCPSYFKRQPSSKNRHNEKERCCFCNSAPIDMQPYQERFIKATESIEATFYALGADFIKQVQTPFMKFFQNQEKYPLLTNLFEQAVPNIDRLGLSMAKPSTFTIHQVYLDDGKNAILPKMRMNSSPESYLKERGFL